MIQSFYSNLSAGERKVFNITIVIVLLAFMDRLFLGPVMQKLKDVETEISTQEGSIKRDLRFLSYKAMIEGQSKDVVPFMTKGKIEEDVVNTEFFRRIERLAKQTKVSLVKSNPSQIIKEKDYYEYYATLDCVGEFKDVVAFMHAINTSEDLFKVVKFNLTPKRGASEEVTVALTIVKLIVPAVAVEAAAVAKEDK